MARQSEAMTHDQPAARAQEPGRRRLRRRSPSGAPRRLRGRSSGLQVLRIALRAIALRAALDPGDHCGPWEQEQRAGPGLPRPARGAQTPRDGGYASYPDARQAIELAFDSHKKRENYKPRVVSRIK